MGDKAKKFILLIGDIILLYASLYFALFLRYQEKPDTATWSGHLAPFSVIFIVWLIIFYIFNLYNLHLAVNNSRFYQLLAKSIGVNGAIAIAFFYLVPGIAIAPKRNLFIFIIIFSILFIFWRNFYNWLLSSRLPKINLALIGYNQNAEELICELKQKPHLGYRVAFVFDGENKTTADKILGITLLKNPEELKNYISKNKITQIILTSDLRESPELRTYLFNLINLKINFINFPNFYEEITGKIPTNSINQMWFLENLNEGEKTFFDFFKRIFDFIFAFIILIITSPFWIIIALIIKIESKGPVFIKMVRCGQYDRNFKMYKFRTMKEEGNTRTITIENDPRITKFGSAMRKTRIDEIPQVLNILKGEMSFIGPRPERPELAQELEKQIPFYRERELVKPGVTGWDQISGEYHSPTVEDTLKKIQYDLFYIKNRSVYLDLSIILKTIATVFSRGGR
ncbi:MAG: exopolysaccharide biosynthesis polyprenyl glycosylphosphotransferase [Patescibacteria group bacterium]|nr:exopolysaccharide biosynthesis polyprenyl glycosylphosphotransferase [Patescibacteria group bacterium]MDD4611070.1 exopolysaccharide biosynthesis polyprenyl glycosylphosphotransferase [Patescibacteria group bacterium]